MQAWLGVARLGKAGKEWAGAERQGGAGMEWTRVTGRGEAWQARRGEEMQGMVPNGR